MALTKLARASILPKYIYVFFEPQFTNKKMKETIFELQEFREYHILKEELHLFYVNIPWAECTEEQRYFVRELENQIEEKCSELLNKYISSSTEISADLVDSMIKIAMEECDGTKMELLIFLFYGLDDNLLSREQLCAFFASFFTEKRKNIKYSLILAEHLMDFVMGREHPESVCYSKILFEKYQKIHGDGFLALFNKTFCVMPVSEESNNFLKENVNYSDKEVRDEIEELYQDRMKDSF